MKRIAAQALIDDCDVLLMVGTNFPYTKHLPKPGTVRVVQIDTEPTRLGVRLPVEAPVVGDAAESLMALLPSLEQRDDAHLKRYQAKMTNWRAQMEALENPDRTPIAPQYVAGLIDDLATDYGAKVSKPGELPDVLRAALAHNGPALVDVDVDPSPCSRTVSPNCACDGFIRGYLSFRDESTARERRTTSS
ncbi:MAG: hypothetical protein ACT4NY_00425 [Pseudonocardiales bacterium]